MRIISGIARGCRLETLPGEDVRPTTDRVKEGMFSILQFSLPAAKVLDLFAGSGQLGIEALSRGAQKCYFIDNASASIQIIKKNLQKANLAEQATILQCDSLSFITSMNNEKFDVVILDPPYQTTLLEQALDCLNGKLEKNGIVLCEHTIDKHLPEEIGNLKKQKEYKYGKIKLTKYVLSKE